MRVTHRVCIMDRHSQQPLMSYARCVFLLFFAAWKVKRNKKQQPFMIWWVLWFMSFRSSPEHCAHIACMSEGGKHNYWFIFLFNWTHWTWHGQFACWKCISMCNRTNRWDWSSSINSRGWTYIRWAFSHRTPYSRFCRTRGNDLRKRRQLMHISYSSFNFADADNKFARTQAAHHAYRSIEGEQRIERRKAILSILSKMCNLSAAFATRSVRIACVQQVDTSLTSLFLKNDNGHS